MTPEARVASIRGLIEAAGQFQSTVPVGIANLQALLSLLPAAGEALVLGPEGWEKRGIFHEAHEFGREIIDPPYPEEDPTVPWVPRGSQINPPTDPCPSVNGYPARWVERTITYSTWRPLASEEMNP